MGNYWSSSQSKFEKNAWMLNFYQGEIYAPAKFATSTGAEHYYACAIREF